MQGLDEAILRAVHATPAWAIPIFFAFTVIGGGWGLVVLVPFALRRRTRATTLWLLAGITVTSGLVSLLKALIGRVRPCDALAWCTPMAIASPGGPSFPSGHAAGSFAFAVFVAHHAPRLSPWLFVYAAIVSVSRCVLGVHYPSDVVFGALLGAATGSMFARAAMKHNAKESHAKGDPDAFSRTGAHAGDGSELPPPVQTLLWLCEIPSPIGEERALADALAARLARVPLAEPIRRHGDSLVVPVTRRTGGPHIILAGHLDVVRTSHDGPPRIEGDRLYGPGASDMKSGLALMIDLIESDLDACRAVDMTLVLYAREEGPYLENELGVVLERDTDLLGADLAVCLEPSDNKLSLGASGSIHATVTFTGRTAHSARPWQGENAIHKAGAFLVELDRLGAREVVIDGLLYRTVTSATMAEGGRGRNIIPDAFTLNVNHRFSPDTTLEQAQEALLGLVAGRASVTFRDLSPSAPPFARHPLVELLREAGVVAVEPKQAWTDVARFAALGIPAVNFGPGENAQAHQRNEWTSIEKVVTGRTILLRWLRAIQK